MVFQLFVLMLYCIVVLNVVFGFEVVGMGKKECECCVMEVFEQVGFVLFLYKLLFELLGGMQQCVGFVCVLVVNLLLMIMDEVFFVFDLFKCCEMQDVLL